ncbi:MAG TPA: dihydroorotase [Hellea balneolensis]|uniref:Dihydroorotase n=1 Tax=Hellea balneolensis TaxID=287478 RepID=A0A7V5NWS8_9PROT|nr:dihydroorotase [Hellea balneolensis]
MSAHTPDRLAIRNARLIDPASGLDQIGDMLIEDGTILRLGQDLFIEGLSPDIPQIEAGGLVLAPGLIDMRVVTGEPGAEHKETLASAGRAAAAGGVTSIVVMPSTDPVIDDVSLVDFIARRGADTAPVRVYPSAALTRGLKGEDMTEIGLMSAAGAVLFSNGDLPIGDAALMRRIMAYASGFNALIAHRPADVNLSAGAVAHESDFSARLGLPAAPSASERIMVARDLALAELTGARFLVDLVSARQTLPMIKAARKKGLDVSASVSINHLALNEMDIGDYRTFAKLDPPLREEEDRQALLAAVADGTIDIIVSSHDPKPAGDKRRPFVEAGFGAVGLELLLSAGLTLVAEGALDLLTFLRAVTIHPAELLGLPQGRLAEGAPADLVLFDPGAPWKCDSDALLSKSENTPFDDRLMQGKAVLTIVEGKIVFDSRGS